MVAAMPNGGDQLPVFYVIRLVDESGKFLGAPLLNGFGRTQTLYLFTRGPDAWEFLTERHPDPENAEVVGSDELGGILALLGYASPFFPRVTLNPPPVQQGPLMEAMRMNTFIRDHVFGDAAS